MKLLNRLIVTALAALTLTGAHAQIGGTQRPVPPNTRFQGLNNELPAGSKLTINGTITIGAAGTFDAALGTYAPSLNVAITTGHTLTLNSGGTMTLSGALAGTPTASTVVWGNVTFTTIGSAIVPTGKTWTFNSGSTLAINGTLSGTPTGGTLDMTANTLTLGSTTFPTGKTITFSSGSTIVVSGVLGGTPTGGTLDLSAVTQRSGKRTIGASTAAAGSVVGDAAALPAGTADVYLTTAADDTKGVILSSSDKVAGRVVFIANGVSNKILKLWPPTGGVINGAAANASFSSDSGKGIIVICTDASGSGVWAAW